MFAMLNSNEEQEMLYWTDSHTEMDFANQRPSQFVLARSHYIVKSQRNYLYLEAVTVCCGQKLLQYEVTEKLLIPGSCYSFFCSKLN